MKVTLRIAKNGTSLYEGVYDIRDAVSFSEACGDAWTQLRGRKLETATSIGALYEALDESVLNDLRGARIVFDESSG
jgi:hypothetical protein